MQAAHSQSRLPTASALPSPKICPVLNSRACFFSMGVNRRTMLVSNGGEARKRSPLTKQISHAPTPPSASISLGSTGGHGESKVTSNLLELGILGSLFGAWYACNIAFNIYNKEVLKAFPLPLTCTTVQFMVGSALAILCWLTGLVKKPQLTKASLAPVLPLAVVHTLGNLLTNVSLGAVAVSFTHTIKAMEPIFSVALSAVFLGEQPHPLVLLTLVPIMGGVALASVSEISFNWTGFLSAMASNLTFQSRNVLSKKLMLKGGDKKAAAPPSGVGGGSGATAAAPLDNLNLFCCITVMSCLLLLPINLLLEGWQLTPAGLAQMGVANPGDLMLKAGLAGLCFHAYQQVSYMILSKVSPVTHSIGNCVKRVVVIVASVIVFRNPMTLQSATGTAIALLGVFAYSQVKRQVAKPKTA